MNREQFKQSVEKALVDSPRLWDWPQMRETLVAQIMNAHDETVEATLEEYEQALNDDAESLGTKRRGRSSLECPEDVDMHVVEEA